ncbi:MAG: hypothetical protein M0Z84_01635 [Gammaproteobacteria bacterium]|nr:hypothetical protein [Gammaproteobacteria bacterium]
MTYDAIPSLVALVFKAVLLAFASRFPARNAVTRLYLALLVLLSFQNVVEFVGFTHFARYGLDDTIVRLGYAYFAIGIAFFALILHLSLRLSIDCDGPLKSFLPWLYLPVLPLEYLLLFTHRLVAGFRLFEGYTVLRIAGPLYFLFEAYVPLYLVATVVYLVYGARNSRQSAMRRTRNRLWLLALSPFVLINLYLVIANHFGLAKISSTVYLPLAITFFLIVTAYATHQFRLFDIEFFIPWSKLRGRKTAFYARIQAMIRELAGLKSVKEAIARLADTLGCPVVLVGAHKGVLAMSAPSAASGFPESALQPLKHIVVADEVAERHPSLYEAMRQHNVAAIVPFHAASESAAGWLLLGDPFSRQVYTARDFRIVEQLFDRLADSMLDHFVDLRRQLVETRRESRALGQRLVELEREITSLRRENQGLRDVRQRWAVSHAQELAAAEQRPESEVPVPGERTLDDVLSDVEARLIEQALRQCGGNKSEAARMLGLRPNTLHYKLQRHGLMRDK